jgi:hypothetical protein
MVAGNSLWKCSNKRTQRGIETFRQQCGDQLFGAPTKVRGALKKSSNRKREANESNDSVI